MVCCQNYISIGSDVYDDQIWPGMDFNNYGVRMLWNDMEKLYPNHFVMYKNPIYKDTVTFDTNSETVEFIAATNKDYEHVANKFIECNNDREGFITCFETGESTLCTW